MKNLGLKITKKINPTGRKPHNKGYRKMKFPSKDELSKMFKDLSEKKVKQASDITCLNAVSNWSRRTGGKRPLISAYYNGQKRLKLVLIFLYFKQKPNYNFYRIIN